MACHDKKKNKSDEERILLIGPPNVGKSVIFNYLTRMGVLVANYAGTTVEYTAGKIPDTLFTLVDVPGIYTLHASNVAEEVALEMLDSNPVAIISVLDALHLTSSIYLLLQVLEKRFPTLVIINRCDLLEKRGNTLKPQLLAKELGVKVLEATAVTGEGLSHIKENLKELERPKERKEVSWEYAQDLSEKIQTKTKPDSSPKRLEDLLIKPFPGLILALLVLIIFFAFVIGTGMGLRRFFLLPFFRNIFFPLIESLAAPIPPGWGYNILFGEYGILLKGIEWPFTLVLPYVLSFHLAFSFLGDSGYLPRLGVLLEGLLKRVGLKGSTIIPLLLGYGCGIPGVLATRSLANKKERIIVSSIICLAVPCIAQSGAFISLLAERSLLLLFLVLALALLSQILGGLILNRLIKGSLSITLMEIPELLMPRRDVLLKKTFLRLKEYLKDGAIPMVGAVGIAGILYETGIMVILSQAIRPLVTSWLNLPEEATLPLLLGIFRREMAVLPLLEMNLTTLQVLTGAVLGLFYVPCIAMVATLAREFSLPFALFILFLTTSLAFLLGGLLAQFGLLFS